MDPKISNQYQITVSDFSNSDLVREFLSGLLLECCRIGFVASIRHGGKQGDEEEEQGK